jgi:hypothetical protein
LSAFHNAHAPIGFLANALRNLSVFPEFVKQVQKKHARLTINQLRSDCASTSSNLGPDIKVDGFQAKVLVDKKVVELDISVRAREDTRGP